ncbi:hypothetical protein (nucleomorph) [Guillardia theta]|uniref:E3 ubiquitin protein ligase n=1 Tax=Guillardia theta TaxID=55529 RepID=Q98RQ9_GUITH|nr:hypothetical protein GTHECHR1095 [Guillardia theta]AAK39888.1 hypothetical protein [Guillardia theta]
MINTNYFLFKCIDKINIYFAKNKFLGFLISKLKNIIDNYIKDILIFKEIIDLPLSKYFFKLFYAKNYFNLIYSENTNKLFKTKNLMSLAKNENYNYFRNHVFRSFNLNFFSYSDAINFGYKKNTQNINMKIKKNLNLGKKKISKTRDLHSLKHFFIFISQLFQINFSQKKIIQKIWQDNNKIFLHTKYKSSGKLLFELIKSKTILLRCFFKNGLQKENFYHLKSKKFLSLKENLNIPKFVFILRRIIDLNKHLIYPKKNNHRNMNIYFKIKFNIFFNNTLLQLIYYFNSKKISSNIIKNFKEIIFNREFILHTYFLIKFEIFRQICNYYRYCLSNFYKNKNLLQEKGFIYDLKIINSKLFYISNKIKKINKTLLCKSIDNKTMIINELRSRINCPVLKNYAKEVILINCGHTFSTIFINSLIKSRDRKCPLCRLKFSQSSIKNIYF